MKKNILAIAVFMAIASHTIAQTKTIPLKTGDTVPEIQIEKILNYKSGKAKFSDFKGKLVILDFFATWCIPCINGMPKLQNLKKEFGDKIEIILVSNQNTDAVSNAFKNLPILRSIKFPIVVEDKRLKPLFPHVVIPHDIIIDRHGVVKAITSLDSITPALIKDYLNGSNRKIAVKKELTFNEFNFEKPLFIERDSPEILYHSLIAKFKPGAMSRIGGRMTNDTVQTKIYAVNTSAVTAYRFAYKIPNTLFNRVRLEVKDSVRLYSRYNFTKWETWAPNYAFCYDLVVPIQLSAHIFEIMQADLDRFFLTTSSIEKRTVRCFKIKGNVSNKLKSKSANTFRYKEKGRVVYNSIPFNFLVETINENSDVPIINETGFTGNVDMSFVDDFNNYDLLKKQFNEVGLDLLVEDAEIDLLIIKDKINTKPSL